jgi:hypothetical protein
MVAVSNINNNDDDADDVFMVFIISPLRVVFL